MPYSMNHDGQFSNPRTETERRGHRAGGRAPGRTSRVGTDAAQRRALPLLGLAQRAGPAQGYGGARTLLLKLERSGHIQLPPRQRPFCNAHLMRELVFLWEQDAQAWDKTMIDHLLAIKTAVETARQAGQSALTAAELDCFHARYLQIVDTSYTQNPAPEPPSGPQRRGRGKQSKARNLDRFREHPGGILAFMRDFAVPFDNNLSERDLRMMKLRQKISGPFRSIDALVDFCRIRGYVSTTRKNGLNALDALRRVFLGNPFVPAVNTD